jgi:hypothetical protein
LRADSYSASRTTADYDVVYLRTSGVAVDWAGVRYSSLAAFVAATGQESHGREADPRFVSAVSANFRLAAGSPAIDAANSSVAGQPLLDADDRPRIDDPATPNTGTGSVAYADRGAYEFAPA